MPDGAQRTQLSELVEAAIPAAAFMVKGFFEAGARLPDPDDFDDADLGALWEAILAVQARKLPMTKINVQRQLREMDWDDAKGFAAMGEVARVGEYLTLQEALAAVQDMLDRRLRRQFMRVCKEALNESPTVHNVQELVSRTEKQMSDLASQSDEADNWVKISDVKEDKTERLATLIDDLDRVNHGLPIGELTIGAGRTGMGKSAFAATMMLNTALQGHGVAAFSLEMRGAALLHRMAAAHAYEHARLKSGRSPNPYYDDYDRDLLDSQQLEKFITAREAVRQMPIKVDDRRGRTLNQIRLGARRARMLFEREGKPLKLLVVDHIGKVVPDRYTGSRHLDLGDTTEGLAAIGAELDCSVFALAQLSREVEKGDDKRPMLHHLRESGRIEEDAHTIMLFYRPGYYYERAKEQGEDASAKDRFSFEVDIAKNRGGQIKRVPLFCEIGANAILSKDDKRVPLSALGTEIV